MILDGKLVRKELLEKYKKQIEEENLDLTLAIILVGDNAASGVYVRNKLKYAEEVGIKTRFIHLDEATSEEEVINIIEDLNKDDEVTGMILQSPVPSQIDMEKCIEHISPLKDIDGFTKESFYALAHNLEGLRPCTPKGIMMLLDYYHIDVAGKKVCIVGRGNIVGKPLFFEMLNKDATVTLCHSKTANLKDETICADIIVTCCGKQDILTDDMVKEGAIVVDAGITVIDGKIHGDVDYENVSKKCDYITPNPGGVGPMTVAMIMDNVIYAEKMRRNKND